MRVWKSNVEPPLGWEVNPDLSRRYGRTIITETIEQSKIQKVRKRKGLMALFEERKQESPEDRRRKALVAAGVAAGTIGSGAGMWKIGHDRAVLDDYERRLKRHDKNLTDTENRLRSEREGMEASKSRSQVQKDFKGNTDALPPTMRPGGDKRKQYREERLGKVMGVGHIKDRGRRKAVRGKWKNGKFIPQKSILQYILPDKRIPKVLSGLHR